MYIDLLQAYESRQGARFFPRQREEGQLYDCITFMVSVYEEVGVLEPGKITPPDYATNARTSLQYDVMKNEVIKSKAFLHVDTAETFFYQSGDLLLFSKGERAHHCAIMMGERSIIHCVKGRGVVKDSLLPPLSTHVKDIFRPLKEA